MKRFLFLAVLLSSFATYSVQAQGIGVHVGPKLGLALSAFDGQLNAKTFWRSGFSGGLMMRCRSSERFAIQPEILYVQQGTGSGVSPSSSKADYEVKLNYLQVPIMLKIYIGSMVNVQFGPQAGLLLSGRQEGTVGSTGTGTAVTVDTDVKKDYYDVDVSVSGGLGLDLHNGLLASVRYNYGFVDINNNRDQADLRKALHLGGLHNRGFEFSVGYLIGAAKDKE